MTGFSVNWGLDLDRRTKERRLADERLCRNIRQRKEAQAMLKALNVKLWCALAAAEYEAGIEHMLYDYWGLWRDV